MNKQELINRLKSIISNYAQNTDALDRISDETDFIRDLRINSANLVDVILDVEEEFDITIDNESMEKMLTVGASIVVIEDKINQK